MDQNGLTDDRLFQRTADLVESGEGADVARGLELAYKAKGIIRNGPQVIAVFASLGVWDENEARTLIALGRDVLSATQAEAIEQAEVVLKSKRDRRVAAICAEPPDRPEDLARLAAGVR